MNQHPYKFKYPNGLTLIVDTANQFESVSVGAWVKTGSRFEDPKFAGISHFIEHMLFKGRKKKNASDLAKIVDQVGGDFNAFTTREHTCIHLLLPYEKVKLAATLFKEILFKPHMANAEIERERSVIRQEIAMVNENPEEEAYDQFFSLFFQDHPLASNILGTQEGIQNIQRKNLLAYFHKHYRPENILIVVSGRISPNDAKKIFSVFGSSDWPNRKQHSIAQSKMKPLTLTAPVMPSANKATWHNVSTEQVHMVMGAAVSAKTAVERAAVLLVQNYLGGGMSSVLFDQIREKRGLGYSVYANEYSFLDATVMTMYAGVRPDPTAVLEATKVFEKELAKILKHGISTVDLRRLKEGGVYANRLALESTENRMIQVAQNELFIGRPVSFQEYEKTVMSIKSKFIKRMVHKWYFNKPKVWLFYGPWLGGKSGQSNSFTTKLKRICKTKVGFHD